MYIRDFLALPHRFQWGGDGVPHHADPEGRIYNDCTTFCATWASHLTGIDPAADLRGTYRDEDGAHAILRAAGGIVPFMASKLEPLGFKRVQEVQTGDIGVIHAVSGFGTSSDIAAICFGPLWAALGHGGISAKNTKHIAAWRMTV